MNNCTEGVASPIFVIGNSRSGTTMMGKILGSHPRIFTFHELHFFEEMWSPGSDKKVLTKDEGICLAALLLSIEREGYISKKRNIALFSKEAIDIVSSLQSVALTSSIVFDAFLHYETNRHTKSIPCDQTPRNVFYLQELMVRYPNGIFINMIRDPRDILLSQKNKWKRHKFGTKPTPLAETVRVWMNYHPITISKLWNSSVCAAYKYRNHSHVLTIRFEDILLSPEENIRAICDALGQRYYPEMLQVPQEGSSLRSDAVCQTGVDRNAAGNWRKGGLTKTEIFLCEHITRKQMQAYNYDVSGEKPNLLVLCLYAMTFPVKLALSLLLNIRRTRNIVSSIVRRVQW